MVQKGSILILKPYVDNQHDDNNNNMVPVKKVNNYDNLLEHIRNTYTERSNMEIRLMIRFDNDPIRIKKDEDYQFFLEVYKDSKKEIKVYFESTRMLISNEDHMFSMQNGSKLRFEKIEDCPEQNFQVVEIDELDKKEIKNGKFLIAICDEDEKIKSGVEKDVDYYQKIAKYLGFSENNIDKKINPKKEELFKYFDTCGEKNNVDCFVFAFSGHGHIEEENEDSKRDWVGEYVFLQSNETVKIQELVERLTKNKYLTGIPKIMLLSACRGDSYERTYKYDKEEDIRYLSEQTTTTNMENIILAYSTIPNKYAWIDGNIYGSCGSIFAECLHNKIKEDKELIQQIEFHQLLTEVNDRVAACGITDRKNLFIKGIKQTSCFRSSLCEELYFK